VKISIVTISFNQGAFLERTILSVLEQDYSDIEYILVDAGSVDGSREIVECYRTNIDKIILESDEGPADGSNRGFAQASDDSYIFINLDYYFLQGVFRELAAVFSKTPRCDVLSGHSLVVDEQGKIINYLYSRHLSVFTAAYSAAMFAKASRSFNAVAYQNTEGCSLSNRLARVESYCEIW